MTRSRGARSKSAGKQRGKRAKLRRASKVAPQVNSLVADQKARIDALTREVAEARQRETAASEVLEVISSSPGDLQPVFQAMLENATRICEAGFGSLFRYYDGFFRPAAMYNVPREHSEFLTLRGRFQAPEGTPLDRLVKTGPPA